MAERERHPAPFLQGKYVNLGCLGAGLPTQHTTNSCSTLGFNLEWHGFRDIAVAYDGGCSPVPDEDFGDLQIRYRVTVVRNRQTVKLGDILANQRTGGEIPSKIFCGTLSHIEEIAN
jgi:hypothetical protein